MVGSNTKRGINVRTQTSSKAKAQIASEYLAIFGVALFLLVMVIILVESNSLGGTGNQIPSQSTCYISVQLHCFQFQITNNGISGTAILLFTNNLGTTIYFREQTRWQSLPQVRRARISAAAIRRTLFQVQRSYAMRLLPDTPQA